MKKFILILTIAMLIILFGCKANSSIKEDGIYAEINTSKGEITCKLFYKEAPITVGNFIGLAEGTREIKDPETGKVYKKKFYNGLIFHRVVKDFVIQGGCPNGNGTGSPGYTFVDEFSPDLKHDSAGILSMANSGPNTNGSQFFITLVPTPHLDGKHSVFGKVISDMDVLKKIENVKVEQRSNKPYEPIYIKKIKIIRVGEDAKAFNAEEAFAKNDEILKELEKEKEKKMEDFLRKIGVIESKIITTEIGLKYYVRKAGTGISPEKGDVIVAHYAGYLSDGKKFDSSYDRKTPFETQIGVGRVIPGWDEAFIDMKEGEKRVLILPYYLGYGERGYPPTIPPKATLIFDVELISVKKR